MAHSRDNIINLPDKRLRDPSKKVGIITEKINSIADNMVSATLDWEDHRKHEVGVALAAVQIAQHYKIVIIRNNFEDKNDRTFQVLINPKVTKAWGGLIEDFEGCLSIKDIYGKVPRYEKVKVKAKDQEGHEIQLNAEGFLARVLQHEIDHTKGTLFIDHIRDNSEAFFTLTDEGKLEPLDYTKKIKDNKDLWDQ